MRTIVISAVNLRRGGTLTILRQCLEHLSRWATPQSGLRVVAIVHKRELANYPNIEYIELPKVAQSWGRRMWCEYITMHKIARKLSPVYFWLSLHDMTPHVEAEHRAVYCHTPFPFMKFRWSDLSNNYRIAVFTLLYRFAYRINIHSNEKLIVQAEWLKKGFTRMFHIDENRIIIAPPETKPIGAPDIDPDFTQGKYTFFFASTADSHKNFECLCEAARLLEQEIGPDRFLVMLTVKGDECTYARKLYEEYAHNTASIRWMGYMDKKALNKAYWNVHCLVFPSVAETWGLPISEFNATGKPMLLADLPYAHETAIGSEATAFFDPLKPEDLKNKMRKLIENDLSDLKKVPEVAKSGDYAYNWYELFTLLGITPTN